MTMTGADMRKLRKFADLTQAELGKAVGLSRKSINEAEALGDSFVDRRTEMAVLMVTSAAKAKARLLAEVEVYRITGDTKDARRAEKAAALLDGRFATDVDIIYNLAMYAASGALELQSLRNADKPDA